VGVVVLLIAGATAVMLLMLYIWKCSNKNIIVLFNNKTKADKRYVIDHHVYISLLFTNMSHCRLQLLAVILRNLLQLLE